MRNYACLLMVLMVIGCSGEKGNSPFTEVQMETLFSDSLSIRAIELMNNSLAFAADQGVFGSIDLNTGQVRTNIQKRDSVLPEFRAVAHTATDFFMLSVSSPALLYKTGNTGMQLVYMESGENVFYDAMTFWNDKEGIAIGDAVNGCISIIITRDGGLTWNKVPCTKLPKAMKGEGAFAASNTNIKTIGGKTWVATTSGQVYFSGDKGGTWEVQTTPILGKEDSQGIYSIDFYNESLGIAVGGDYTHPEGNSANKAITEDGGESWTLLADGQEPNYKSCVRFVPNSGGNGIVAVGFTGITYSSNKGQSWAKLSDEPFYTLRFLNDSIAYAAGKNRISKLSFTSK
ncbi:MAG: oxidoreductase [Maribacter sp.]|nr:MAG: oxidoreductase [Maribacter sp.]